MNHAGPGATVVDLPVIRLLSVTHETPSVSHKQLQLIQVVFWTESMVT